MNFFDALQKLIRQHQDDGADRDTIMADLQQAIDLMNEETDEEESDDE